jgi:peptidyl-prolyl cis-trans isomerase B (cyclophilin B)
MRAVATLLALLAALVLAGCGGDDDEAADTGTDPGEVTIRPTTAEGGGEATTAGCRDVEQPQAKPEGTLEAPTAILNEEKTYEVTVKTSCGDFTITLDPKASPNATASFVALAEADFFDDTVFHRIVPGFVIQGGDPLATGLGGPGYSTVDTPAQTTTYEKGVVAMAKAGAEAAGTAGSQFFIVTADDAGLPPEYAVIGHVTDGLDVVERIGVLGDPNTEQPTQPVVIDDMNVVES